MSGSAIEALRLLVGSLPSIIRILEHYTLLSQSDNLTEDDKEKSKELLQNLKWKPFDEI